MNLCKDCRHVKSTSAPFWDWRCQRIKKLNRRLEPLTGEARTETKELYAFNERDCGILYAVITGRCGRSGRFWEAKKP